MVKIMCSMQTIGKYLKIAIHTEIILRTLFAVTILPVSQLMEALTDSIVLCSDFFFILKLY